MCRHEGADIQVKFVKKKELPQWVKDEFYDGWKASSKVSNASYQPTCGPVVNVCERRMSMLQVPRPHQQQEQCRCMSALRVRLCVVRRALHVVRSL